MILTGFSLPFMDISLIVEDNSRSESSSLPFSQTTCQAAVSAVESAAEIPVILSFDETLFLRNSTEAYLDSIYPRPLGAAFLVALQALRPWRLFSGSFKSASVSRDWTLVVLATLLFPWTLWIWQRRAKELAKRYYNPALLDAIAGNAHGRIIIATSGFDFVVRPLLRYLPIETGRPQVRLIACRFWKGALDRARGKLAMVTEAVGEEVVTQAIAVTNSAEDASLLEAVAKPFLLRWPQSKFVPAMADVYVPLFYSEKIKNPNKSHIVKRILLGHWGFLIIALSCLSPHPFANALGLLLLVISYWCIYEVGYQENDLIGEQYEEKPILSNAYVYHRPKINLTQTLAPWYAALAISLPGIFLLNLSQRSLPLSEEFLAAGHLLSHMAIDVGLWAMLLIAVRLSFWIYNRFNEEARIWIYPILQIQKLFGFTLIAGTSIVGALLLVSLIVSRWLHYSIYRCGGDRWQFPLNLCCFVMFGMLFSAVALSSAEPLSLLTIQSAIAFGYCLLRAVKGWRQRYPLFDLLKYEPQNTTAEEKQIVIVSADTHQESN